MPSPAPLWKMPSSTRRCGGSSFHRLCCYTCHVSCTFYIRSPPSTIAGPPRFLFLHLAIVESSFHGRGSSIHVVVAPCKFGILLQRLLVLRDYCFCAFKPWSPPSMNGLHPSALLLHLVFEKSCFHNSLSSNNFGSAFPSLGVLLL